MKFKIGDKVVMRDERKAFGNDVRGQAGEVVAFVDDGTSVNRITVEFPNGKRIEGMDEGQFELA